MNNFELLKRTYPISQHDRHCDGYEYIMKNSTTEIRDEFNINENDIKKTINVGEKYIYQVGKENGKFKVMCISYKNYEIIRKLFFGLRDE